MKKATKELIGISAAGAMLCLIALIGRYDPGPQWISPVSMLPPNDARVTGIYIYPVPKAQPIDDQKYEARKVNAVYLVEYSPSFHVEYWLEDDGSGGAARDLLAPVYWAPRDVAEGLDVPQIPDILMEALAK